MRAVIIAATCAALSLIAAGCGDDEPAGAAPSPPSPPGAADYGDSGNSGESDDLAVARVEMSDNSFAPATVRVKVGDVVTFWNASQVAHTATAVEGAEFDSGAVQPGASYVWKPANSGEIQYVCDFHPGMKGTITVE